MATVLEWELAKQWLASVGIVRNDVMNSESLIDFAQSLRDGVVLCEAANRLKPNLIRDISPVHDITMHMFMCMKNIRSFLKACETLGIQRKNLFKDSDLYDALDFQKVVQTLSLLSKTDAAKDKGLIPFPPENYEEEESIYDKLPDKVLENHRARTNQETVDSYYNMGEDIYDTVTMDTEEKIYDDMISCTRGKDVKKDKATDKRGHVVNEIFETEVSFTDFLLHMSTVMMKRLKSHLSQEDIQKIFINTKALYSFHTVFKSRLFVDGSPNGFAAITFCEMKDQFLLYSKYCSELAEAKKYVAELVMKTPELKAAIDEVNAERGNKFALQEQLSVPFQRILKYPLLLKELDKQTPTTHPDKPDVQKAKEAMDDVSLYINSYVRGSEQVKQTSDVEKSMKHDMGMLKSFQWGKYLVSTELKVKFETNEKKQYTRHAFIFETNLLLCKSSGDTYEIKENYDLKKFNLEDIPNQGRGKFAQGWSMKARNNDGVNEMKNAMMLTKTTIEKTQLVSELIKCIERLTLTKLQDKIGEHQFELQTFETTATCHVCGKYLQGRITQGHQCSVCQMVIHYECLEKCPPCSPAPQIPSRQGLPRQESTRSMPPRQSSRSSISSQFSPTPPKKASVSEAPNLAGFRQMSLNDRSTSLNQPDNGAAIPPRLPPGRGAVPPSAGGVGRTQSMMTHRTPRQSVSGPAGVSSRTDLEKYPWFAGPIDREKADQLLKGQPSGAFMIREGTSPTDKQLRISITYNSVVKHIKVYEGENNLVYLTEPYQFTNLQLLIQYYMENSLETSFPSLPTTLTKPVRSKPSQPALAQQVIKIVRAKYAWAARDDNQISFEAGSIIKVLQDGGNYWRGECGGNEGFFPRNYVEEVQS